MNKYLDSSKYIDWKYPDVLAKSKQLSKGLVYTEDIAKVCFEFVRDEIKHSTDYQLNSVTCKASDVLKFKTGFCYAKSHLLAALLRANNIPAGLCYQRLSIDDEKPPFCLHGLNAIYLPDYGWYRVDPRGNKEGVNAQFIPPMESLAFPITIIGEADFPEIFSEPLSEVTSILTSAKDVQEVADNLPDIELI